MVKKRKGKKKTINRDTEAGKLNKNHTVIIDNLTEDEANYLLSNLTSDFEHYDGHTKTWNYQVISGKYLINKTQNYYELP